MLNLVCGTSETLKEGSIQFGYSTTCEKKHKSPFRILSTKAVVSKCSSQKKQTKEGTLACA